jgi:outer membrane protein assembly factor BamB
MGGRTRVIATIVLASAGALPVSAQTQWNQFRGPEGRGVAADAQPLPATLDPERNLAWSCDVPLGHSSPCIWGDRIFLTGATERVVETICIDRTTGAVRWRQAALTDMFESRHRINSAATPTPATDGEHVVVYFGSCGLIGYDFDGNERWLRRMRIPENMYGTATSPIMAGGRVVFLSDNASGSFLEAIDPATGATIWRKDRSAFTAGWSTPMCFDNDGVAEIVCYGVGWITAYALEDGAERWSMPGVTDEPCITPAAGAGLVFVTSYNMRTNPEVIGPPDFATLLKQYDGDGDGVLTFAEVRSNRSILSRHDAEGEGDHPLAGFFRFLDKDRDGLLTAEEWDRMQAFLDQFEFANGLIAIRPGDAERETEIVWQQRRGVPECPSPLFHEGRVYTVKNGGIVSCVDAATGAVHFQTRLGAGGPYYASPVVGDGKVYAASAGGVVTVFAEGDTLEVLARNELDGRIMATPALAGGAVYVRTDTRLLAFERPVDQR